MERKNIISLLTYRSIPIIIIILFGLIGINNGIYFKDIPEIGDEHIAVQLYYVVSLFLMSGVDLGMPLGDKEFYRILVLLAYFLAPVITVTSALETIIRSLNPNFFKRRYKNHVIIIGASEIAISRIENLKKLKEKIIIVDNNRNNVNLEHFKKLSNIRFIIENYNSPNLFERLNIDYCKSIWLLTDDDFLNIELTLKIKNTYQSFKLNKLEVRCESEILKRDIFLNPEMKKILSARITASRNSQWDRAKIISNNKNLTNIFYYKYFYYLHGADNIVIYGCNDFTDALIKVLTLKRVGHKKGQAKKIEYNNQIKKILVIDSNKDRIESKKQYIFNQVNITYEYKKFINYRTHEDILKKFPVLDCTKFLLLGNDFRLNSKLAFSIMSTSSYHKPFTNKLLIGNPIDKLIYRGNGNDFDDILGVNSSEIVGGFSIKRDDELLQDELSRNGKSDTFKDIFCFDEHYENQNLEKTYIQIEEDEEFEIPKRENGYIKFSQQDVFQKPKLNRRYLEYDIGRQFHPKQEHKPALETLEDVKNRYEKIINREFEPDFLQHIVILGEDKAQDRKELMKLIETLIEEEKKSTTD